MTSQGVEFDGQVAVTEDLVLGGAIAYLDSQFEDFSDAPCTIHQTAATPAGSACRQDLSGETGPFAPEWSGNFYAKYDYQLGNNLLLSLGADASYKDDFYTDTDLDPNSLQESYWKFNARIALSDLDGTWEVAAYGRNLTDEATISYTVDAPLSAGIYANGREEPRVYGLQARYFF
jgi:outer membrane receptor protein involved in Fe transport